MWSEAFIMTELLLKNMEFWKIELFASGNNYHYCVAHYFTWNWSQFFYALSPFMKWELTLMPSRLMQVWNWENACLEFLCHLTNWCVMSPKIRTLGQLSGCHLSSSLRVEMATSLVLVCYRQQCRLDCALLWYVMLLN